MTALINRHRVTRLGSFASTQLLVQVLGFLAGLVAVRTMHCECLIGKMRARISKS
jgi:hypothetical protein